jgi:hypothetical protein
MKKLAILGPLGLLVVSSAHAQTNPFSVRVGYSYLTNSSASDLGKQSGYLVGLGYDFFEFKKDRIKLTLDVGKTTTATETRSKPGPRSSMPAFRFRRAWEWE